MGELTRVPLKPVINLLKWIVIWDGLYDDELAAWLHIA
jgi:hypothetical protein